VSLDEASGASDAEDQRSAATEQDAQNAPAAVHTVTVKTDTAVHEFDVKEGVPLRKALRDRGFSPHNAVTSMVNCGGQGHCATCAVTIESGAPTPRQWLDAGLDAFGWGRVACMVPVERDMVVRL
jgi:ferredoxin